MHEHADDAGVLQAGPHLLPGREGVLQPSRFMNVMATQSVAGILAERLGREPDDVRRLVDRFSAAMAAGLLGGDRLVVEGLGNFSVLHEAAARKTTANGIVFVPPKNRVVFEQSPVRQGCLNRIARERLGMDPLEAAGVSQALAGVFGELRKRQDAFDLRGFGSFGMAEGRYGFTVDAGLDGLLNTVYEDVEDLALPAAEPSASPYGTLLKPLGIAIALLLLAAAVFVLQPWQAFHPGAVVRDDGATRQLQSAETVATVPAAGPPESAEPDSGTLPAGHYTIVAATVSSKRLAREESMRLAGMGHRTRFWTVYSGGDRYYRLVTGDFATEGEARASLQSMSNRLPKHAFVQQAPKKVVLYGEDGL